METIKDSDKLETYQEKMKANRRTYAMANAIIKRARVAEIPDAYLRIGKEKFLNILDVNYHNDNFMPAKNLANYIYDNPSEVMYKYSFIVIDGGDETNVARKVAGMALLFRFIACDKNGKYVDCANLVHKVQSLYSSEGFQEHRNDVCLEHKGYDSLFVSECRKDQFRAGWESGIFVNEILEYRDDYKKPTIISFTKPLPSKQMTENKFDTADYGRILCMLSGVDQNPISSVLRIRVKDMREWKNE